MAHILLVEDNPELLEALTRELLLVDHNIRPLRNGNSLIEVLNTVEPLPDMIISDISLPDISGRELLSRITRNPHWCHIPFLFLMNFNAIEMPWIQKDLRPEDYLIKPFTMQELLKAVRHKLR